jgi:hypothetical protein
MKDSEAISTARVCVIVTKLTNSFILWAHVSIGMCSNCVFLQIIPIGISVRATTVILNEVIIGVGDPEARWRLIGVEQ